MGEAGIKGAQVLGLGAPAGIAGKAAQVAVKGAIESAIFQGGNEVGKMLLSDPNQSWGAAATSIGLAGLIGAPFSIAAEGAMSGRRPM